MFQIAHPWGWHLYTIYIVGGRALNYPPMPPPTPALVQIGGLYTQLYTPTDRRQ